MPCGYFHVEIIRRVLPSYGNRIPAVLYVSMNMCLYGNEVCTYVASCGRLQREDWVPSTLTLIFIDPSTE